MVVTLGILPHSTPLRVRMTARTYNGKNNGRNKSKSRSSAYGEG